MKKQLFRLICAVCAAVLFSFSAQAAPQMVIPGGSTVGISLQTKGLLVTGFADDSVAQKAGLKKGDVIVQADGEPVRTAEGLKDRLDDDNVVLTVLRGGKEAEFCVVPKTGQIGAYVRDSVAGIGTVTYYDPVSGRFGALGHGVNDMSTAQLIPVEEGLVVSSCVTGVERGKKGTPGELKGRFDLKNVLGHVQRNCAYGIFGTMTQPLSAKPLPVGTAQEVEPGEATIMSNVTGESVKAYHVQILEVDPHAQRTGRNLLLEVTDRDLLQQTGGIVQGMSGSPIIQDGKLVGAVTHVLVNDPTRGYGIFIENMLDAAG